MLDSFAKIRSFIARIEPMLLSIVLATILLAPFVAVVASRGTMVMTSCAAPDLPEKYWQLCHRHLPTRDSSHSRAVTWIDGAQQ